MTKELKSTADGHGWMNALVRSREGSLVLLIAVLTVLTTALNPRFISPQSLKDLMLNVSIIALLVLGQTVIILMRQIDLSISSIVGITAFLSGTLFINHPGIPSVAVVLIAVLAGLLLGAVNAALIAWGKIPALITTLGTLYIFRGANYAWVHGRQVNAVNVPGSFLAIGTSTFAGIPLLTWIVLVLLVRFFDRLTPVPRWARILCDWKQPDCGRSCWHQCQSPARHRVYHFRRHRRVGWRALAGTVRDRRRDGGRRD